MAFILKILIVIRKQPQVSVLLFPDTGDTSTSSETLSAVAKPHQLLVYSDNINFATAGRHRPKRNVAHVRAGLRVYSLLLTEAAET